MFVSFFNKWSSFMKYYFIGIIFPYNFDSRNSKLVFREEFPIVKTRWAVFIPAIAARSNDLFMDGMSLLIISLSRVSLTWFSTIGDIKHCEGEKWGAFDIMAVSIGLWSVELLDQTLTLHWFWNFNNWLIVDIMLLNGSLLNKKPRVPNCPSTPVPKRLSSAPVPKCLSVEVSKCLEWISSARVP